MVNVKKMYFIMIWEGIVYLGFIISWWGVCIYLKSVKKFKDKVCKLILCNFGCNVEY